jgi:3',5'-cyclic AMP phosphodiesterase CpdA
MKTVVHLSDLHFGREDPVVVEALIAALSGLSPDVVAVSGDLTQRARRRQFRRAAQFLEALPCARVVVPGNHDVPLFNLFARVFDPLGGYKRHIAADLAPTFVDPPVVIVGLDTTCPSSVKSARVHARDIERICGYVQQFRPEDIRILVAHHPFDPGNYPELQTLTRCGIDVILTGHLHVSGSSHTAHRHQLTGRSAVVVEAGTATSTRLRETTNAFNVLRLTPGAVVVERHDWLPGRGFAVADRQRFDRTATGWLPSGVDQDSAGVD